MFKRIMIMVHIVITFFAFVLFVCTIISSKSYQLIYNISLREITRGSFDIFVLLSFMSIAIFIVDIYNLIKQLAQFAISLRNNEGNVTEHIKEHLLFWMSMLIISAICTVIYIIKYISYIT